MPTVIVVSRACECLSLNRQVTADLLNNIAECSLAVTSACIPSFHFPYRLLALKCRISKISLYNEASIRVYTVDVAQVSLCAILIGW